MNPLLVLFIAVCVIIVFFMFLDRALAAVLSAAVVLVAIITVIRKYMRLRPFSLSNRTDKMIVSNKLRDVGNKVVDDKKYSKDQLADVFIQLRGILKGGKLTQQNLDTTIRDLLSSQSPGSTINREDVSEVDFYNAFNHQDDENLIKLQIAGSDSDYD